MDKWEMLYKAVYLEINLICAVIPAIILFKERKNNSHQTSTIYYNRTAIVTMLILFLDALWIILNGKPDKFLVPINNIVNVGYMIVSGFVGYYWLKFVLHRLNIAPRSYSLKSFFIALPQIVLSVLCVLSPWTGWIFKISGQNEYSRGTLNFMQITICYGYIIAATVIAVIHTVRATDSDSRSEAISLCNFAVLPVIGGIINVVFFGVPSTWPFASISLMIVYLDLQNLQVVTDQLTGLNNRRQFDRMLLQKTESHARDKELYLLLMDLDKFKSINDTYGHAVGDHALIQAANLLKCACEDNSCFLARYGGDEFAVIFESSEKDMPQKLMTEIISAFEEFNLSHTEPYSIQISIGYAKYSDEFNTPTSLFTLADKRLYEEKAQKKTER